MNGHEHTYQRALLSERPTREELLAVARDYELMLMSVMGVIADRFERRNDYPYIDTKINLITGEDYPEDHPLGGPGVIYGYIQGRGLEALAGHCEWLRRRGRLPGAPELAGRLERIMRAVLARMREVRRQNGGHMFFFMTQKGEPFRLDERGNREFFRLTPQSPWNLSDLFCAKGMYAAATYLGDEDAAEEALAYCLAVDGAVRRGELFFDQQQLDPKNPVRPVPGRHTHAPYMIHLGTAALLADRMQGGRDGSGSPGKSRRAPVDVAEMGLGLIRHVIARHVYVPGGWPAPGTSDRGTALSGAPPSGAAPSSGATPRFHAGGYSFRPFDFWEFVDDRGMPYRQGHAIPSDPGHALEFVGLALKFLHIAKSRDIFTPGGIFSGHQRKEAALIEAVMPKILRRNFENGFQRGAGGICKSYDLTSRAPINTDMPWWSLPEAMRAAALCRDAAQARGDEETSAACLSILAQCHNAFVTHYVRPALRLMAVQTRSADGRVVPVIPATADADPGYHTGLCVIDVLGAIERWLGGPGGTA